MKRLAGVALLAALSASATGQDPAQQADVAAERLDAVDHAARLRRIELTGDLGIPMLPPVLENSPRDSLLFADRFPVHQDISADAPEGGTPTMFQGFLAAGPGGTGTDKNEIFEYQLGFSYDEFGPPVPMVVAYHGYGASHSSVALFSTIDEECNTRGWLYMAPTGIDDQLFGSPVSQQNVEAAIQWMLDNFNIDPERIYFVGFSLGGGIAANFAARRRNPDGIVIAGVGLVSSTYDWTMSYVNGTVAVQALLENVYNFGGSPTSFPFSYQQASDLYFRVGTYPPLPGTLEEESSMATNLGSTAIYHTWDNGDTLPESKSQNPVMSTLLMGLGGAYKKVLVFDTVDPITLLPATHSWVVLDEEDMFDFFDGKTANREPANFSAQLDLTGSVSYVDLSQLTTAEFSYLDGASDPGSDSLSLVSVKNADDVSVDLAQAGLTSSDPIDLVVTSIDNDGFTLTLTNFAGQPAYLLGSPAGLLLEGTESDPLTGSLIREIPGNTTVEADVISDPNWTTKLFTAPNPVGLGGSLALTIDASPTAHYSLLLVGSAEALNNVPGGNKVTVSLAPSTLLINLPLDSEGDLILPATIPNNPAFSGARLFLQTIDINNAGQVDAISNMWVLHIQ